MRIHLLSEWLLSIYLYKFMAYFRFHESGLSKNLYVKGPDSQRLHVIKDVQFWYTPLNMGQATQ